MKKLLSYIQEQVHKLVNTNPLGLDCFILGLFAILVTYNPYFLWGKINTFELGIYLPGIQSILSGEIPYRDFFHLRGPLELYIPALFIRLFGANISILSLYFYIGTIFCLIACVLVGKELYKTRLTLYLMTFVLVARTFPRVIFTFWGGMRFTLGILALWFAIKAFKQKKVIHLFFSGVCSSLAFLTSIEMGITSIFAVSATLFFGLIFYRKNTTRLLLDGLWYGFGIATVILPFFLYLHFQGALNDYFQMTLSVITSMNGTFPNELIADNPSSLGEILASLNPGSDHFKHLTPAYCYFFFTGFLIYRIKNKTASSEMLPLFCTFTYGLFMYYLAFRNLEAGQFEMALQPEKILLFILLEETFLFLLSKKSSLESTLKGSVVDKIQKKAKIKIIGINILFFLFIGSSIGYPIQRYNHRFFAFKYFLKKITFRKTDKLEPLRTEDSVKLSLKRVNGFRVPIRQARNIQKLTQYIDQHTSKEESVFMSPELGTFSFIVNRRFLGRFPMVSFSWIKDEWHEELMKDLIETKPPYAVLSKDKSIANLKVFFQIPSNKEKYYEVYNYIQGHYTLVSSTPDLNIYKRNH